MAVAQIFRAGAEAPPLLLGGLEITSRRAANDQWP